MPLDSIGVPRTKLITIPGRGTLMMLECLCGNACDYPGHPDDRKVVACEHCGQHWHAVPPATLAQTLVEL